MKKTFYSNGKLLITGEYTVLDGATALALPTRYGQFLDVEPAAGDVVAWTSHDADGTVWFEAQLPLAAIRDNRQDGTPEYNTLLHLLHEAQKAHPEALTSGCHVTTRLTFPRQWGLGTSSTLINNIAQWLGADAYQLLQTCFGGSGYDIACAQHNTPITYRLNGGSPVVTPVTFSPPFAGNLWFVYLNRKQNSREAIAAYRERRHTMGTVLPIINKLTQEALQAGTLTGFAGALEAHERLMADVLDMPTVKQALFPDFKGTVKSLGAWGGDFVLAAAEEGPGAYFRTKGFGMVVPYEEMVM